MAQTTAPDGHVRRTTHAASRRTGRLLLALLLAAAGTFFAGAAPASAHAALLGSDPAQGAVLGKAPAEVMLTFSEKVTLSDGSLRVLDPRGQRVDTGKPFNPSGTVYGVAVRPELPKGTYTATYQVVSADSHPVSGAFTFSVGAPSATSVPAFGPIAGGGIVGTLYQVGRYISYAGLLLLIGGAAFVLACWQRGAGVRAVQRLVVSGWLALTVATLALLLLRGSYTGSGKVTDVFDLSLMTQVLQTKAGAALVSRLLLLAAGTLFIAVLFGAYVKRDEEETTAKEAHDAEGFGACEGSGGTVQAQDVAGPGDTENAAGSKRFGRGDVGTAAEKRDLTFGLAIGGIAIAAGLAATWALAEHASTGIQTGLAMPVDVLHLLAAAVWLGGLATLLVALYRSPSIERAAVRRFSAIAFGSVVTLVATGVYQSWRQVGSWSALTGTAYGQLLLVKVALVAVLVGTGWISRRWTARVADVTAAPAIAAAAAERRTKVRKQATVAAKAPAEKGASEPPGRSVPQTSRAADSSSPDGMSDAASGSHTGTGNSSRRDGATGTDFAETGGSSGSVRAAQLARQRAAVAAARAKAIRDADPVRAGLRRSVLVETAVAVVTLAVATALTTTEPGRTEEAAKAATESVSQQSEALSLEIPFDSGGQGGKGTVRVILDPAGVGANVMRLYVTRPNAKPFDVPEVKVAFTLEDKNIGPLPITPGHVSTGQWSSRGVQIPMAGNWKVAVTVRTSDIDQVTVNKNAQIG